MTKKPTKKEKEIISQTFREMQKKSWEKRKENLLKKANPTLSASLLGN